MIETAGLIALTISTPMDQLPAEKQAMVRMAGEAQWASLRRQPAAADAAYKQLLAKYPNEPAVHYAYGIHLMSSMIELRWSNFK